MTTPGSAEKRARTKMGPIYFAQKRESCRRVGGRSTSKVQKAAPLSRVTGRFRRPSFCKLGAREFSAKKRVINGRRCLKSSPRSLSLFRSWRSPLARIGEFLTGCTPVIDSGLLVAEKRRRQRDHYEGRRLSSSPCNDIRSPRDGTFVADLFSIARNSRAERRRSSPWKIHFSSIKDARAR